MNPAWPGGDAVQGEAVMAKGASQGSSDDVSQMLTASLRCQIINKYQLVDVCCFAPMQA
jgi:hypothetical protein